MVKLNKAALKTLKDIHVLPSIIFPRQSYLIEHLEPYTQYEVTLQVKNPEDLGPPASITATTGEGGEATVPTEQQRTVAA